MDGHVDYPHEPGTLYDCYACEDGPCVCEPGDYGCASQHCMHEFIPVELDDSADTDFWNPDFEEYYHGS